MKTFAVAAAALGAVAPPAAAAPTLAPLAPCYAYAGQRAGQIDAEPIALAASGFRPGVPLVIRVDGTTVDWRADEAGAMRTTVQPPEQTVGEREFAIEVFERDAPDQRVVATTRVARLRVAVLPRSARPTSRVRFRGRGFTDASAGVYAHYVRGGKVRRTVRLARRPAGPCGTFNVRRRQFPFKRPRTGSWTIRVDQSRVYRSTPAGPSFFLSVRVRPVPRLDSRRG